LAESTEGRSTRVSSAATSSAASSVETDETFLAKVRAELIARSSGRFVFIFGANAYLPTEEEILESMTIHVVSAKFALAFRPHVEITPDMLASNFERGSIGSRVREGGIIMAWSEKRVGFMKFESDSLTTSKPRCSDLDVMLDLNPTEHADLVNAVKQWYATTHIPSQPQTL